MERAGNRTRVRWLAAAILGLGLALGLLGVGLSTPRAHGDTPPADSTVAEVQRYVPLPGGRLMEVTALVDTTRLDPDAAANAVAPGSLPAPPPGSVSGAFALWRKWAAGDIPVPVYYNFDWDSPGLSAFDSLQWAIQQWNGVAGQSFRFTYAGSSTQYATSALCALQIADGVNTVRVSYILDPGLLGVTCAILDGTTVDGVPRVTEFDLQVTADANWSTAPATPSDAYDMYSVVLHELGHALGLDHSNAADAVMVPALKRGQQLRTLSPDDLAGIRALYGSASSPTPPPTATPTPIATPTPPGGGAAGTPVVSEPPATFYGNASGAVAGGQILAVVTRGNSTKVCGTGVVMSDQGQAVYVVDVVSDSQTAGCGVPGSAVAFYLLPFGGAPGRPVVETATWRGSGPYQLDISAGASLSQHAFAPAVARDGTYAPPPVNTPTPTPPHSPTPTTTPSPTPTPTNTPTPTPTTPSGATGTCAAGNVCVRKTSSYVSTTGTIHIVGEVVNARSDAIDFVKITANFYSPPHTLLATDFTFSDIATLPPGGDSPFDLLLLDPPPGITQYDIQVTDFFDPAYGKVPTGLQVNVSNIYTTPYGTMHIVGTVTNTSGNSYSYVEPIVALYDAAGNVIREDFTFTDPDSLGPGRSATFDLILLEPPNSYATYRMWVDANY